MIAMLKPKKKRNQGLSPSLNKFDIVGDMQTRGRQQTDMHAKTCLGSCSPQVEKEETSAYAGQPSFTLFDGRTFHGMSIVLLLARD